MHRSSLSHLCGLLALLEATGCGGAKPLEAERPGSGRGPTELRTQSEISTSDVVTETLLLDDCGDSEITNLRGGYWGTFDDRWDGSGKSVVWPKSIVDGGVFEMSQPGYRGQGYAARMTGATGSVLGWDFVALAMSFTAGSDCPDPQPSTIDFLHYDGIRFMAKGTVSGGTLEFVLPHMKDGREGNCTATDVAPDTLTGYSDYFANVEGCITEDWSQCSVRFSELAQPETTTSEHRVALGTVLAHVKEFNLLYKNGSGGNVDLWLDEVELYRVTPHVSLEGDAPPSE